MKTVEIDGKEYQLTVNLGTLTFAEAINDGINPKFNHRINLGFILACMHGADPNCDMTMERLALHCNSQKKYLELLKAAQDESVAFSKENEDLQEDDGQGN